MPLADLKISSSLPGVKKELKHTRGSKYEDKQFGNMGSAGPSPLNKDEGHQRG